MERNRRPKKVSVDIQFTEEMVATTSQDKYLSNSSNKDRLIQMLMEKFTEAEMEKIVMLLLLLVRTSISWSSSLAHKHPATSISCNQEKESCHLLCTTHQPLSTDPLQNIFCSYTHSAVATRAPPSFTKGRLCDCDGHCSNQEIFFDEDDGTDDLLESPLSSDNLEEVEATMLLEIPSLSHSRMLKELSIEFNTVAEPSFSNSNNIAVPVNNLVLNFRKMWDERSYIHMRNIQQHLGEGGKVKKEKKKNKGKKETMRKRTE
ncbi:hypothetical protein JTB14_018293 [Gonioctena quinquepunctata]|nr:hypothetical protein JTB14_018293 [Gonioctena quinquepunctata]